MIPRRLALVLRRVARQYPVVTVTGPRQSGKTTLCRMTFPKKPYVSLEPLDAREYARSDPRGFLAEYANGAIVDEVQHAPELLSYLQDEVDARPHPGRFILTGSQHFGLSQKISQSLAGRTAVLYLLPPSYDELRRFPVFPQDLWETLTTGAFPRIHDRRIPADRWLADYVTTYVQRDVRELLNVGDLQTFTTFLRLCAGRTAQEVKLSAVGGDAGVSHNTARAWLSVLETSFLCVRLPAWHATIRKQLVKAPKLHFLDSGLVCHLLGIRTADELRHHPLRGPIFESWVAAEVYKTRAHRGDPVDLFHFRESRGLEVDLLVDRGETFIAAEAKSGATVVPEVVDSLRRFRALVSASPVARIPELRLVYGGSAGQRRSDVRIVPWDRLADENW